MAKASVFCLFMLILFSFLAKTRWCFLIPSLFWINSKAFCGRETSLHLQSFSSLFPKVAFFFKMYELAVFIFIRALDDLEDLWTVTCKLNEGLFSSTKGATMWIRSGRGFIELRREPPILSTFTCSIHTLYWRSVYARRIVFIKSNGSSILF